MGRPRHPGQVCQEYRPVPSLHLDQARRLFRVAPSVLVVQEVQVVPVRQELRVSVRRSSRALQALPLVLGFRGVQVVPAYPWVLAVLLVRRLLCLRLVPVVRGCPSGQVVPSFLVDQAGRVDMEVGL